MAAAIALLSGGLDSTVAAALWLEQGHRIAICLCADYGQRAAARETAAAAAFAAARGIALQPLALPWLGAFALRAGSALVETAAELPAGSRERPGDARSAAAVWVPARNVVLVAAAAAAAEAVGADTVLAGFNREEAATFADNSAAFVDAATRLLATGTRSGVRVHSPTLAMDKAEIVACARRLGFGPGDFWSCYDGGERPCGRCESCLRSARAWAG